MLHLPYEGILIQPLLQFLAIFPRNLLDSSWIDKVPSSGIASLAVGGLGGNELRALNVSFGPEIAVLWWFDTPASREWAGIESGKRAELGTGVPPSLCSTTAESWTWSVRRACCSAASARHATHDAECTDVGSARTAGPARGRWSGVIRGWGWKCTPRTCSANACGAPMLVSEQRDEDKAIESDDSTRKERDERKI
jgi:hypothetical protein